MLNLLGKVSLGKQQLQVLPEQAYNFPINLTQICFLRDQLQIISRFCPLSAKLKTLKIWLFLIETILGQI